MLLENYFDFSCPYAYIGSTQVERITAAHGADLVWRPMLLGGVFQSIGLAKSPMSTMPPTKARHNAQDMHRWAEYYDVPLTLPSGHPMRTVAALRALLTIAEDRWPPIIHAFYRAYWTDGRHPSEPQTIRDVLTTAGIDEAGINRALAANDDPKIKAELRRRTDAAVARGVFGAPTAYISGDGVPEDAAIMLWGQDRLHMVDAVLGGWRPGDNTPPEAARTESNGGKTLEFWYDFSSPFSYLGSTQIEGIAARTGATLEWKPMLLGAIFKEIGTPDVPMLAVSDNKRTYYAKELGYWSSYLQVPFKFTSRFPMKTVTALRLALLAGDKIAPVSHALYKALWVDDRDLNDDAVLADALAPHGFDAAAMIAKTKDPEVKQRLITNTSRAVASGVFGAPTCIVKSPGADDQLFWGQDRLDLVERALR